MSTIPANYHTHTVFCDGVHTAAQMAEEARRIGFTHLGFSGHMDPDIHMDMPAYLTEIHRLQRLYAGQMEILCGVELDNLWGEEPWLSMVRDAEYIIGSTHFLPVKTPEPMSVDHTPQILQRLVHEFYADDYYALAAAYYDFEAQVFDRTGCTMVGHFDLVTRFNDEMGFLDEEDPRYLGPALEAMEYLVSRGVPFEINCGAVNRGRKKELYPNRRLLRELCRMGGEIIINSDAHSKELLAGGFETAAGTAVACGFTHTNLLEKDPAGNVRFKAFPLEVLSGGRSF